MIKAVIVDDEPKSIQSLSWELTNFNDEISILDTFSSPEKALEFLKDNTPDCLFLDIQMPTMDGFQFLNKLTNRDFPVVITTAYDEYAIKALKHVLLHANKSTLDLTHEHFLSVGIRVQYSLHDKLYLQAPIQL